MLANIRYWEEKAKAGHYAIPHFNVWNAEMLMGVMDAAEELRAPVIISFGTGFVGNTSFEDFCWMMESMAKKATVPVITNWDHGRSMEIVQNAYNHGMNSVMRDASAYDFEENIRLTKEVVDYFHPLGVPVEAELGHVGNETIYEEALANYKYTDPNQAAEFVERTNCDSLAVAIGNHYQQLLRQRMAEENGTSGQYETPNELQTHLSPESGHFMGVYNAVRYDGAAPDDAALSEAKSLLSRK